MPSIALEGSRIRVTTFSPNSVGQVLTRKSMARFFDRRILMRPSCGTRRSAISSRDMTLRRATILTANCTGGSGDFLEHAVRSGADAERFLVRLEVDVRGAFLDGVQHDLVHETNDGRVFDVVASERLRIGLLVSAGDLQILEIEVIVGQARHDRFGLIDGLVHGLLKLVVLDNDKLDAHGGLKSDLVEGMQVRWVGDRKEQAACRVSSRAEHDASAGACRSPRGRPPRRR